jgi:hypothetical protein
MARIISKAVITNLYIVCLTDPLSGATPTHLEWHFIHNRVRSNGWLEIAEPIDHMSTSLKHYVATPAPVICDLGVRLGKRRGTPSRPDLSKRQVISFARYAAEDYEVLIINPSWHKIVR